MKVGLNFGSLQRLMTQPGLAEQYMLRFEQCHLGTVRIPLHWRTLVEGSSDHEPLGELSAVYDRFLAMFPDHVRVLGLVVTPPQAVAVDHFDGLEPITSPYLRFLRSVTDRFERLDELELWNEPNANDFYLSVREGSSHRPWTPDEFVDQVVLPGVEFMHSHRPDMALCLASFSENGLVGHDYLPGAPSGLLPHKPRFEALRDAEDGFHGRWHFVPSFGPRVLERIAAEVVIRPGDAVSLHPYPYFQTGPGQTFADKTVQLVQDAAGYLAPLREKGAELWLTEVGCRAHDFRNSNTKNLDEQAGFVDHVFDTAPALGVDRIYWYKFDDAVPDLRQEKTFGLFDHFGRIRPAYLRFRDQNRSLAVATGAHTVAITGDDLEDRSGVDLRQDNIRGFVDGSLTDPGSGAIVFPGRDHGDSVAVTSAVGVAFGNDLLLCAEAVPVGPPGPGTVRLELLDGDAVVLSVESTLDQDSGWTVGVAGPNGSLAAMNLERSKLKVGKFGLIIDSDTARLVAVIGGEEHSTTVDDGVDVPAGVLTPRLVFENRGNGRAMWELVRFVASSDVSSPMW